MSGAETARVQRRIGGAEMTAPKWPSPEVVNPIKYLYSLVFHRTMANETLTNCKYTVLSKIHMQ